jgi:F-type H+-transporting ATPase subunit gamma
MPSLKEVRSRITSVKSTQQITKAMKMVAAAKLRKSQDAIIQMRPYAQKLNGILANLSASLPEEQENPYATQRPVNRVLLIVITADRGLCGAFNSNIIKTVNSLLLGPYSQLAAQGKVSLMTLGKKGAEYFGRRQQTVDQFSTIFDGLKFDKVRGAAEFAMDGFRNGEYDLVQLVYNEFKNVATQVVRTEQLLPVDISAQLAAQAKPGATTTDYLFEPSAEHIMDELIPTAIKVQFYKALLESHASFFGAQMTAMDKATDNAGELLKELRLTYNRSRQAAITKEILEIVGGAEALAAQ